MHARETSRGQRQASGYEVAALLLVLILLGPGIRVAAAGVPPANDRCDDATGISGLPFADATVTTAATTDAADPTPMCPIGSPNSRGKSVWYVLDSSLAGTLVADTFDSDYDTILTAYTGGCGALEPVAGACSDDDPLDGAQSRVSIGLSPGVSYRFMVSAFHDDGGALAFHVLLPVATPTTSRTLTRTPTVTFTPTTATPVLPTGTASPGTAAATPTLTPTPSGTVVATSLSTPTRTAKIRLGDANCDGRISAADLTAVIALVAADDRAPCALDDANGDGVLDLSDLTALVTALFAF